MRERDYKAMNEEIKANVKCDACGAINSICWDKKQIGIDDKAGTWLTLELDFCQECGKVHNYNLYN